MLFLVRAHRRQILLLLITLLSLFLHTTAQQYFTDGLAIIDAPAIGSPGHAGSNLSIAVDVSGNGELTPDATNPNSTLSTHFSLLEIYLVSSETGTNLTVSSGPGLLAQEPTSTVKHVNWVVPTCIALGNYNLTFYETSLINGQPHFIITPVPITIQNANPSGSPCSSTSDVTVNALQGQPQPSNPLPAPIFGGSGVSSASGSGSPGFVTITLSGPLPYPVPSTVTVISEPSPTPTTVIVVSMTTDTLTTNGPSGFITKTVTEAAWSSTVAVTQNSDNSGFLPVNAGSSTRKLEFRLFFFGLVVGFWTRL